MNGSKLTHVRPGDPLEISAGTFNTMIDAAKANLRRQDMTGRRPGLEHPQGTIVLIRNDSGAHLEQFGVLGVSGFVFAPATYLQAFQDQIALTGITPAAGTHEGNFVIAQEPIADGDFGQAIIAGVTIAKVNVPAGGASLYRYADIKNADQASLQKAPAGAARILSIESGTGVKWAIVRFGDDVPTHWAKASAIWTNVAGNGSYVDCYPCDDASGTTVDTTEAIRVYLPRNGQIKDPNVQADAIIPVARQGYGSDYVCVGDYLDEPIGAWKIWHSTTIPAGWTLSTAFAGRALFGYDAADANFNAAGKTGGAKTHTHAGHDAHANHADHSDHPDHGDHPDTQGNYPGDAPLTLNAWDDPPDLSHSSHGSHGSHGAHSAHSSHDSPSNNPEYKTVVMIERTS